MLERSAKEQAKGSLCHNVCMHYKGYVISVHGKILSAAKGPVSGTIGSLHFQLSVGVDSGFNFLG
jgi:hypothetical protein